MSQLKDLEQNITAILNDDSDNNFLNTNRPTSGTTLALALSTEIRRRFPDFSFNSINIAPAISILSKDEKGPIAKRVGKNGYFKRANDIQANSTTLTSEQTRTPKDKQNIPIYNQAPAGSKSPLKSTELYSNKRDVPAKTPEILDRFQQEELFLSRLGLILKSKNTDTVGNKALRASLNFKENDFFEIKESLIRKGFITRGRGKGGSVRALKSTVEHLRTKAPNEQTASCIDDDVLASLKDKMEKRGYLDRNYVSMLIRDSQISFENLALRMQEEFPEKSVTYKVGKNPRICIDPESIQEEIITGERENLNFYFPNGAESNAVDIFCELLTLDELRGFLPEDYKRSIDQEITKRFGGLARARKIEYACALMSLYGCDIFGAPDGIGQRLRALIIKKRGLPSHKTPKSWESGARSAKQFILDIGFPTEFQGNPSDQLPPRLFFPRATTEIKELKDFQKNAKSELLKKMRAPAHRAILMMPTGTGKTRTALETIYEWYQEKAAQGTRAICIWITHTEELCEQALDQLQRIYHSRKDNNHHLDVLRLWGRYTEKNLALPDEINKRMAEGELQAIFAVSTNTTFATKLESTSESGWILDLLRTGENLLVIDEAHRAAADTYKTILDNYDDIDPKLHVIGLTATPRRKSGTDAEEIATAELLELFGGEKNIIDPFKTPDGLFLSDKNDGNWNAREYLIKQKILARPHFELLKTNFTPKIGKLFLEKNLPDSDSTFDYMQNYEDAVSEHLDDPERRRVVVEKLKNICDEGQTIYFSLNTKDAHLVAWMLRAAGIRAAAVTSKTNKYSTRRKIIKQFREGKIQVLCNCQLLTTGFDHPGIRNIVISRPTISTVLYEQMIGRGLRGELFSGTTDCRIINVIDELPAALRNRLAYIKIEEEWTDTSSRSKMPKAA